MEKIFRIKNLDCANCALKLEKKLSKIKGIESVEVNFLAQKITICGNKEVFESKMDEIRKICKKFDDCEIVSEL